MNKVILIGHLGHDPEVKQTQTGRTVANFSLATNERWVKDGEKQERTDWHRIVAWGATAENCGKYLKKGRQVCVEGKIQTRKWQDKDGNDRWTTEVIANIVEFLGSKGDSGGDSGYSPPPISDDELPF